MYSCVSLNNINVSIAHEYIGTYASCTWGGFPFKASNISSSRLGTVQNIVYLLNPKAGPDAVEENGHLAMIEHWGALPVLLQTPISLTFSGYDTPYCCEGLSKATKFFLSRKPSKRNLRFKTLSKPFVYYVKGVDGKHEVYIEIKPIDEPKLVIEGHYDYSNHPNHHWAGKQYAVLDTDNIEELVSFASARTLVSHPKIIKEWEREGRKSHKTCLVYGSDDKLQKGELAKHKILDLLPYLLLDEAAFLSAHITMICAGHINHHNAINVMHEQVELVDLL